MNIKGLLKRFVPFFLALGLGLLVASFFVSVALPNFSFKRSNWRKHREYHRVMEMENQRLRQENCRLRKEAMRNQVRHNVEISDDINELVPPPPPLAPAPPRALR